MRLATQGEGLTGVLALVVDEKENAVTLRVLSDALCCQDGPLQEGQILLVKEPFLTRMSDTEYGIRVDHVSDLVIVPLTDKMVPPVWRSEVPEEQSSQWAIEYWTNMGYMGFNMENFQSSIEWSDPVDHMIADSADPPFTGFPRLWSPHQQRKKPTTSCTSAERPSSTPMSGMRRSGISRLFQ